MNIAIYPGTFDPITYGHIDVIKKSLNVFNKLIVATTDNINKNYYFSIEDRLSIIHNSLFKDLKLSKNKIKIISFDNLTIDLCKKHISSRMNLLIELKFTPKLVFRNDKQVSSHDRINELLNSQKVQEDLKK